MSFRSRSYVTTNGEEPPFKKKKASQILPHATFSSLPDDLVISCLAHVSRLYYPTISLVSKKFRSLLTSPELYETRSLLGVAESCLYVFLRFPLQPNFRWLTLCQRPDTTKKKKKSSGNILAPIRFSNPPKALWPNLFSIGSNIYSTGGFIDDKPSSNVSILDCRSQTWQRAPNMQVARRYQAANVIDGKIYVAGGRIDRNSFWFDSKARLWRVLKGLKRTMPKIAKTTSVKLADYGGKIAVLWDKRCGCDTKVICCVVIAFERRNNSDEIRGMVEWSDVVLTVPTDYRFVRVLSTIEKND